METVFKIGSFFVPFKKNSGNIPGAVNRWREDMDIYDGRVLCVESIIEKEWLSYRGSVFHTSWCKPVSKDEVDHLLSIDPLYRPKQECLRTKYIPTEEERRQLFELTKSAMQALLSNSSIFEEHNGHIIDWVSTQAVLQAMSVLQKLKSVE